MNHETEVTFQGKNLDPEKVERPGVKSNRESFSRGWDPWVSTQYREHSGGIRDREGGRGSSEVPEHGADSLVGFFGSFCRHRFSASGGQDS